MKLHVGYLLDRSGSMSRIWNATIDGLNQFKNEQVEESAKAGEDTFFTLWAFDNNNSWTTYPQMGGGYVGCRNWQHPHGCHHHHWPISESKAPSAAQIEKVVDAWNVKHVLDQSYTEVQPRGGTPLLDAIGDLVEHLEQWERANRNWFDGKILVVIQTDGHENMSRRWKKSEIRDLITRKTNDGWEFAFMGAGIDAVTEGTSLGIFNNRSYQATAGATMDSYNALSASVSTLRSTGTYRWEDSEESVPA